jgi:hypothetical protein
VVVGGVDETVVVDGGMVVLPAALTVDPDVTDDGVELPSLIVVEVLTVLPVSRTVVEVVDVGGAVVVVVVDSVVSVVVVVFGVRLPTIFCAYRIVVILGAVHARPPATAPSRVKSRRLSWRRPSSWCSVARWGFPPSMRGPPPKTWKPS